MKTTPEDLTQRGGGKAPSPRAGRLYRRLVALLPESLRGGFEDEIAYFLQMRLEEAGGPWGKARVWVRALWDLFSVGASEWFLRKRGGRKGAGAGVPGGARGDPPGRRSPGGDGRLDAIALDIRFAVRILRRSPSFTVVAALTLALGIGCTTLTFGLVRGVLLRPLPFPEDGELVVLRQIAPDGRVETLSFPNFEDLRDQSRAFSGIAALRFADDATILGGPEPARGTVLPVSREFFSVLGVMPVLGRPILPEENREGGEAVAVVGFEFWSRALGAEEKLEDLSIAVSGTRYRVVGVMPRGFRILEDADVYLPLERSPFRVRSSSNYRGIGRLAAGTSLTQAQVEIAGIGARIVEAYPEEARLAGFAARPLRGEILGDVGRPLLLLLGSSMLLLLLACSNVASTLLARRMRRQRELAVRTAVGGGRGALVRLLFVESFLLAGLSGVLGVGLTVGTIRILRSAGPGLIPRLATVSVDGPVLAFALGATLLTSLVFGLLPAFRLPEPASALRGSPGRAGSGRWGGARRTRGRPNRDVALGWSFLVSGQVTLAVALVVASGLLLRSMQEILSADTHFREEGVLTVSLDFSGGEFASIADRGATIRALRGELASLPGVSEVGFGNHLPDARRMMTGAIFRPPFPQEGYPEHLAMDVGWRVVDEGYFRAMGIPLREGRTFSAVDGPDSRPVIVLNEAVARALFPPGEAVGGVVQFVPFWENVDLEVIGVVAEARDWRVPPGEQPEGFVFWPQRAGYTRQMTAVLFTPGDPASLVAAARARLRAVAPTVPGTFRTLESLVADSFRERAFTLWVLGVFAFLSLFLSAVGIYGVVSYTVSARSREIGIRLALGASTGKLRTQIFLRAIRPVAAGLASGIGVAIVVGSVMQSLLFQVSPRDPATLVASPLVLLVSAALATLIPVFRHTRVDAAESIREE